MRAAADEDPAAAAALALTDRAPPSSAAAVAFIDRVQEELGARARECDALRRRAEAAEAALARPARRYVGLFVEKDGEPTLLGICGDRAAAEAACLAHCLDRGGWVSFWNEDGECVEEGAGDAGVWIGHPRERYDVLEVCVDGSRRAGHQVAGRCIAPDADDEGFTSVLSRRLNVQNGRSCDAPG